MNTETRDKTFADVTETKAGGSQAFQHENFWHSKTLPSVSSVSAFNFDELSKIVLSIWSILDPIKRDIFLKSVNVARAISLQYDRLQQQSLHVESDMELLHSLCVPDEPVSNVKLCIRYGCTCSAINNPDCDNEYCSSECAVAHCQDVFKYFIHSNKNS